jgi:hypothetical protein
MKKRLLYLLSFIAAGLLAAQLFQPPKAVSAHGGRSLLADPHLAPGVRSILERSCMDCHSGSGHTPWYGSVSPVSWLIAHHVEEGRQKLDFDNWPRNDYSLRQNIADAVDDRSMPLRTYCWAHRKASLSQADIKVIETWADGQ